MSGSFFPLYSEEARLALEAARKARLNYGVQILRSPEGRVLAVLGEAHLKLPAASEIGKRLVNAFLLRGVEGFPKDRVFGGRLLYFLIIVPRVLLRAVTFGLVKDSTIRDAREAKAGHTFSLESVSAVPFALHAGSVYLALFFLTLFSSLIVTALAPFVPPLAVLLPWLVAVSGAFQVHMLAMIPAYILRKYSWSWLIHPLIGILASRDKTMAEGTVAMLKQHPTPESALIILGRAHMKGYARELVENHGFAVVNG
jgi:hypothetical protein